MKGGGSAIYQASCPSRLGNLRLHLQDLDCSLAGCTCKVLSFLSLDCSRADCTSSETLQARWIAPLQTALARHSVRRMRQLFDVKLKNQPLRKFLNSKPLFFRTFRVHDLNTYMQNGFLTLGRMKCKACQRTLSSASTLNASKACQLLTCFNSR